SGGRHLRDHTQGGYHALVRISNVCGVMIEGRPSANGTTHHGHWVSVTTITAKEAVHLLMNHCVMCYAVHKVFLLCGIWKIAIKQKIASLKEVALLSKLLDRVATVQKYTFVTIDIGDLRFTRGSR